MFLPPPEPDFKFDLLPFTPSEVVLWPLYVILLWRLCGVKGQRT